MRTKKNTSRKAPKAKKGSMLAGAIADAKARASKGSKGSRGSKGSASKKAAPAKQPALTTTTKTGVAIPPVGETLVRSYKGREVKVKVLPNGFEWNGTEYRSLTAVAKAVTGAGAISGPWFFGLAPRVRAPRAPEGATLPSESIK